MIPRWHILLGLIFTILFWLVFPNTNLTFLSLIFLSSFSIDIDHYLNAVQKTKKISLQNALTYYKKLTKKQEQEKRKGIKNKEDFNLFHTLEFHILVGLLGFLWSGFYFVLIGMVFHSLSDLVWQIKNDYLYTREYFFVCWINTLNTFVVTV